MLKYLYGKSLYYIYSRESTNELLETLLTLKESREYYLKEHECKVDNIAKLYRGAANAVTVANDAGYNEKVEYLLNSIAKKLDLDYSKNKRSLLKTNVSLEIVKLKIGVITHVVGEI